MTLQIPVDRMLDVVREFQGTGGASLGFVAWELCVEEATVAAPWARAAHDGLLEPAGQDLEHGEDLWRLSRQGWAALGVSPASDRRRRAAIDRLGVLSRGGDPALAALTRLTSHVAGGCAAAVHIFDDRFQHRIAAYNAPLGRHPAHDALCRLTLDHETPVVVSDAVSDERFAGSSFVRGPEPIRFYAALPLRTLDEGTVVGTLCAFDTTTRQLSKEQVELLEDLAQQVISQLEFSRLAEDLGLIATHDALTGAVNRLLLTDRLQQALVRSRRSGGQVLVMVLDINAFRSINATHGLEVGDQVLVAVADRLRGEVRATDTVARLGGDEFAVIAEVPSGDALGTGVIDRLRAALSRAIPCADGELAISVRLGAAVAEADDHPAVALARADRALSDEEQ